MKSLAFRKCVFAIVVVFMLGGTAFVVADVNEKDSEGMTALMRAAQYNSTSEIITTLLKAGADPKAIDAYGEKAIDYAWENENLKNTAAYWELNDVSK